MDPGNEVDPDDRFCTWDAYHVPKRTGGCAGFSRAGAHHDRTDSSRQPRGLHLTTNLPTWTQPDRLPFRAAGTAPRSQHLRTGQRPLPPPPSAIEDPLSEAAPDVKTIVAEGERGDSQSESGSS